MCNQVTVHDVPVSWRRPYLLVVTYDPGVCVRLEYVPMPVPTCPILFRVADLSGKWVPSADIELSSPKPYLLKTDQYGRAYFLAKVDDNIRAKVDDNIRGAVTATRFRSADITATCSGSEDRREKYIRLEKR